MSGSDIRLLALDGGGVRGLSALMILEKLMEAVDPDAPPKPCDFFDMIGGTSTGGLIAIMLGRLRMSVAECIVVYLSLSARVFRKIRHRVTARGKVRGRFDSEELARAIKEVVVQQGLQADELLEDTNGAACKVFVCAMSKDTSDTVCLTSYRTPRGNSDLVNSVRIWEACRATSAATSFFDPIAMGRFGEEFVDGAIGANNPVQELWHQAQLVWGPELLESKIKCLVSIGTGVPSLKPFKDDMLHLGKTLVAIATETEVTAEKFRRERPLLDSTGRYYRFNVVRGLEDIGLEEAKKAKEIAAATRRYISSQEVDKQMQACAGSIAGREYLGIYQTVFSLEGVPRARQFVDRPAEMEEVEHVLMPRPGQSERQKVFILRGLGGIGKTQLAVEFARRHHHYFSSVFWIDGRSEDNLRRSIASCASRIPQEQISETSRTYASDSHADVAEVVGDVLAWLSRPDNNSWLLIFDNVDREYRVQGGDPQAYDVKRYLPSADHGSVIVTTRLARLEQLGKSQQLGKVSEEQAQAIFESWYKEKYDPAEGRQLLALLDGLPLAIAQAGAYLQESGVELVTYLRFYEQQWRELIESNDLAEALLQDYRDRSVWTTWVISYQAIRDKHEATANLLLLWSYLDHKDLWYGLLAAACKNSARAANLLSKWIGGIASSELEFSQAMLLLRNYSLVEKVTETKSYATHPVVHRWAHYSLGKCFVTELSRLAVVTIAYSLPSTLTPDYPILQRRMFPHVQACSRHIIKREGSGWLKFDKVNDGDMEKVELSKTVLIAIHLLADLYRDQGRLGEAEQMFNQALQAKTEVLGPTHAITLDTVNNLGLLYAYSSKLCEAEKLYEQALRGKEKIYGPTHLSTLDTVNNLGNLYAAQNKLDKAEQTFQRALQGYEEALGPSDPSTLYAVHNIGNLYADQGKLDKAEQMYERALRGKEDAFGPTHVSTLQTVNNLGTLYEEQGKLEEAEQMYERVFLGNERAYGLDHPSVLQLFENLGCLYKSQGKLDKAEQMFKRALQGHEELAGDQIQWYTPALKTLENMGNLHLKQGEYYKAQAVYTRALEGHHAVSGRSEKRCTHLEKMVEILRDFLSDPEQPEYEESWAIASEACKLQYYGRKQTSAMSIQEVVAASEDSILQRNERKKKKKKKEKEKVSIWELVRRVF